MLNYSLHRKRQVWFGPLAVWECTVLNKKTSGRGFKLQIMSLNLQIGKAALGATFGILSVLFLGSCNGSGYTPGGSESSGEPTLGTGPAMAQIAANPENSGLISQVVVGSGPAVVSLFDSGAIYFSPNGRNPGGGCTVATSAAAQVCTLFAYSGSGHVLQVVAVGTGVETLFADGLVFFSPDGVNLGGGGKTVAENDRCTPVSKLVRGGSLVYGLAAPASTTSSDCGANVKPVSLGVDNRTNGGIGNLVYVGFGIPRAIDIAAVGTTGAAVSVLADGTAIYSADYTKLPPNPGGVIAYSGSGGPVRVVSVGGGVETQFAGGSVYLSPDGLNLGGGGRSVRVNPWVLLTAHGEFGAVYGGRDSAKGAIFAGKLWLSGGFHGPQGSTTSDCGTVCSFYDLWYSSDWGHTWSAAHLSAAPSDNQPAGVYDSYSPLLAFGNSLWALGTSVWGSAGTVPTSGLSPVVLSGDAPAEWRAGENSWAFAVGGSAYFIDVNANTISTSTGSLTAWVPQVNMTTTSTAPFLPRCGAAVTYALNKFWIMGGGACDMSATYNDIWSSSDGHAWNRESKLAEWSPRMWPCIAVDTYGTFWLIGGYGDSHQFGLYTQNYAEVWYSIDGINWKQYKAAAGSGLVDDGTFQPRHAPTCYVRPDTNTLIVAAGKGGTNPTTLLDATNGQYAIMRDDVVSLQLPPQNQLP